jgi:hypothetical protein
MTTDQRKELALSIARLAVTSRLQDLSLFTQEGEVQRGSSILAVLEWLDPGTYLIGAGPYTREMHLLLGDETVLGRLATPLEEPHDQAVDIFVNDAPAFLPRLLPHFQRDDFGTRGGGNSPQLRTTLSPAGIVWYVKAERGPMAGVRRHVDLASECRAIMTHYGLEALSAHNDGKRQLTSRFTGAVFYQFGKISGRRRLKWRSRIKSKCDRLSCGAFLRQRNGKQLDSSRVTIRPFGFQPKVGRCCHPACKS